MTYLGVELGRFASGPLIIVFLVRAVGAVSGRPALAPRHFLAVRRHRVCDALVLRICAQGNTTHIDVGACVHGHNTVSRSTIAEDAHALARGAADGCALPHTCILDGPHNGRTDDNTITQRPDSLEVLACAHLQCKEQVGGASAMGTSAPLVSHRVEKWTKSERC